MAAEGPDPHDLESWKEAFQYPIPTVRRVEQELRRDIASNRDKLRSLVGARYRDLLGTAETIVDMNGEIRDVEENLIDIGRRCNPRAIETKAEHMGRLRHDITEKGTDQKVFAAQLALLHRCTTAIYRLLRKHGSPLLVAKLLVISRLVRNTLSQSKHAPPFLETLRKQLASLHKTVLRRINRQLVSPGSSADDIVEAMSAFCLATSSPSTDVISHFHKIRMEAISFQLGRTESTSGNTLKALKLYIRTLQNTKLLFGRRLSDALGRLKARPILVDPEIQKVDGLDLEVLERWVGNDIKNFTPWIKHSDLSKTDAEKLINEWSKNAFEAFMDGFRKNLEVITSFHDLIDLRKRILDVWLPVQSSTPTHSPLGVLEGIRNAVNNRLGSIVRDQAKELTSIGLDISSTITTWDTQELMNSKSLWDPTLSSFDFSNGAVAFKQEIIDRSLGHGVTISHVLKAYNDWLTNVEQSRVIVDELKRIRWEDILDDDEDEDIPTESIEMLNKEDPRIIQQDRQSALVKAFSTLQTSLHGALGNMSTSNRGEPAAFLLRIIRGTRRRLPPEIIDSDLDFAHDLVPRLHEILAKDMVSQIPIRQISRYARAGSKKVPGRTLWKGDPEIPVQPSPATFKLLRRLVSAMEDRGPDLWNASSLDLLKQSLSKEISASVTSVLESHGLSNGADDQSNGTDSNEEHEPNGTNTGASKDSKIQLLFDVLYLEQAFSTKAHLKSDAPSLRSTAEKLQQDIKSTEGLNDEVSKAVSDYWKRTALLFGLLS
ncbi:hypothetical protein FQN54_008643 [Arachnomyces sp. PD_36]|nr:hypothetical protein FQN54_008643 [Arachnomyces sp. PD_36]